MESMSLIEKLKIVEQESKTIKRQFFVFYEGNEAEKSLVNHLKASFDNLIITPLEEGVQLSISNLFREFIQQLFFPNLLVNSNYIL